MKTFILIILCGLFFYACDTCTGPYPVSAITVIYPNSSNTEVMKVIRTQPGNLSAVVDTQDAMKPETLDKTYLLDIVDEDNPMDYIFYLENSNYQDTITDINIKRNDCDDFSKFEFKLNGIQKTKPEISIQ